MKNKLFVAILLLGAKVLLFADFEFAGGLIGGFGPAAIIGLDFQFGYISPLEKPNGEQNGFRWCILSDLGIGVRYQAASGPYGYYVSNSYGEVEKEPYHMTGGDYNVGVLGEVYFIPLKKEESRYSKPEIIGHIGIGFGGGITNGAGWIDKKNPFNPYITPYIRAEIPFLFNYLKVGLGLDYIFWKDEPVPAGITLPEGYRINLFISIRKDGLRALFH